MATFSKTGFKTINYNSFRPRYPPSFYEILSNYSGNKIGNSLDIGCGTGIATYDLLNISDNVEGVDLSPSMIKTCNDLIKERCESLGISDSKRISFNVGDLDNLDTLTEGKYDLIVGAQCLHWSKNFDQLFKKIYKLLKPNGVFAYWYYVDPIVTNASGKNDLQTLEKAKQIYFKYMYDDENLVGPHWEQPGRSIIKNYYKEIDDKIPSMFKDVKINNYEVDLKNFEKPTEGEDLVLVKENINIDQLFNYVSTYSGLHNYLEANPESKVIEDYANELKSETGWTEDTSIDLVWNTGYTLVRK